VLYREFAEAGLADIISLNFDRRIARAAAKELFDNGPKNPREGPKGRTLYRHSLVTGRDGPRPGSGIRTETRSEPRPGYYAHVGPLDPGLMHILPTLAGLEPMRFRSYDDLWSRVRGALT
jgi:hypothetical protein